VLLHYLVKRKNAKIAFPLKCCIIALLEFNQLLDFFNLFDSQLILMLLYDSRKSFDILALYKSDYYYYYYNAISYTDCWVARFRRKEVNSAAAVGLCHMHNAAVRCLLGFLFRKVMQKH